MTWWNSSWRYRKRGNIAADIFIDSNVTNDHVLLLVLDSSHTDFWSHVKSDGSDVRIVASDDATELSFHFEKFDYGAESAIIWFEFTDTFSTEGNNFAYLYYGNAAATDAQDVNGTYPSAYKTVYHLNETADPQVDSTSSGNDLSSTAEPDAILGTDAKINGGNYYSGAGKSANDVPATNLTFGTGAFSFSCWVNQDTDGTYTIVNGLVDGSTDWKLRHSPAKKFEFITYTASSGLNFNRSTSNSTGVFYHLVCTRSGNSTKLFVNGAQEELGFVDSGSAKDYGQPTIVLGESMAGYIDEVKFFNYELSQDEISLLYANENNALITFADEEINASVEISAFVAKAPALDFSTSVRGTDFIARLKDQF